MLICSFEVVNFTGHLAPTYSSPDRSAAPCRFRGSRGLHLAFPQSQRRTTSRSSASTQTRRRLHQPQNREYAQLCPYVDSITLYESNATNNMSVSLHIMDGWTMMRLDVSGGNRLYWPYPPRTSHPSFIGLIPYICSSPPWPASPLSRSAPSLSS